MQIGHSHDAIDDALRRAPRDPASRRFIEAWLGWRGMGALLPKRAEIDIADIKALLGRVILFELAGPDDIRIKVAGSQLRDHTDFEATGRNFAELTLPQEWPLRRYRMTMMATLPCGGVMITYDRRTRGEGVTLETVTLPLAPDEPAKPPLLISNVTLIDGVFEPPVEDRPQIVPLVDEFRFVDLGMGVPERARPQGSGRSGR
jgi:hypothetical protein